ncbi:TPA: DUF669 domain-containing protein [Vibrio harveyi]
MQLNQLTGQDFTIQDDDLKGFDKLPKGKYRLYVNSYKVDELPEHGIVKLVYDCVVTEGESQNRKVFLDFPTTHSNAKVVEIAIQNLKKFMVACGKRTAVACEDAVGTFPIVEVSYQKDKNDPSKEYARYSFLQSDGQPLAYSGATGTIPANQPAQHQPVQQQHLEQAAAQDVPPWMQG